MPASATPASHRIHVSSVGDFLLSRADEYADNDLLIFPDERHTYASFVAAAYRRAASLAAWGIGPGDAVGVLMANCLPYMEFVVGANLLGALAVPVNARYRASELKYVVEDADLKLLVTSDLISEYADFGELLVKAFPAIAEHRASDKLTLADVPKLEHLVMLGARRPGFLTEAEFHARAGSVADVDDARARVRVEQHAIMMYTSGTTANPKGCPLGHGLLVRNGVNMNRERYFLTPGEVFWAPLPMFHMASVLPFLCCIDAGAAMSSMTHVEAGLAIDMLERDRVAVAFPAFPTVTNEIISHEKFAGADLSNLRRVNNVAPIEVLRRFQAAFPQAVQTGAYGLTEAGGVISYNHPDEDLETRLHTCGKPFPGVDVRITDPETLAEMPVGEPGEMWVKGYCVFDGYHKSPEKNAEAFHDGWFRTGDLCSVNADGAVGYHGRIKDMLKVGGENVAALEIESFLSRHPAVQLAQVVARPDERLQEVPVAFIELQADATVDAAELDAFCRGELASFKIPRDFYFVTEWPMSSTKVQKYKLLDLLD